MTDDAESDAASRRKEEGKRGNKAEHQGA